VLAELQSAPPTSYAAAVSVVSRSSNAKQLVSFLRTPAALSVLRTAGLEGLA
jgi:ABC-type molybdate transport system substrate-binding protein